MNTDAEYDKIRKASAATTDKGRDKAAQTLLKVNECIRTKSCPDLTELNKEVDEASKDPKYKDIPKPCDQFGVPGLIHDPKAVDITTKALDTTTFQQSPYATPATPTTPAAPATATAEVPAAPVKVPAAPVKVPEAAQDEGDVGLAGSYLSSQYPDAIMGNEGSPSGSPVASPVPRVPDPVKAPDPQ